MSPAHPLGLRIASRKLNAPFIGVSQYYFYNQLKQNIVISKSTALLSKQLAMPIGQVASLNEPFGQSNAGISEIAYPRALPISVVLKAKQLFDSQYALSRRRLLNVAIHYAAQFQQQYDAQLCSNFTNRVSSAFYFNNFKAKGAPTKLETKKRLFAIFLFTSIKWAPHKLLERDANKHLLQLQLKTTCLAGSVAIEKRILYSILSHLIVKKKIAN